MDSDRIVRLQQILRAFFHEARRENQAAKLEPKNSENRAVDQKPHAFDRMIDVICKDLAVPNPGTDGHSLNVWPHPIDGWGSEREEERRRLRITYGLEKAKLPDDLDWLAERDLRANKAGWVR